MKQQITLLDGAWGTLLMDRAAHEEKKAPIWSFSITHPEVIGEICRAYAEAGSEIICANTFGANRLTVGKESSYSVEEVVTAAVRAAKESLAGSGVKTALDIGPLPVMMDPYGTLMPKEAQEIFAQVIAAGEKAGADCIFLETFLDPEMLLAAVQAAKASGLPFFCSMSFEKNGKTLFGSSVEDIVELLEPLAPRAIGMNCSLGPDLALPVIREFAQETELPLFFKPNAGMPRFTSDGKAIYDLSPQKFARQIAPALECGRIAYLGGCCGTDPGYIRELKELIEQQ